jgi:PAS domain S-box-containing protein
VAVSRIQSAIENDRLVPVFQPVVDLRSGLVTGFEVLTRYEDPQQGLILPANFIRDAEEQGLISALTERVMRRAFTAARMVAPERMLNINISPLQLRNRELPSQLKQWCRDTGWPLNQLTIEITESALIDNLEMASRVAEDLKSMGCRLALDDFGTGYSSLIHLRALPFDELKVDRSFVAEMTAKPESRKIVRAVLELARNLGLDTVAEGVETVEQDRMLFRLGCDFGQGWLFGKPVPASEIRKTTHCPLRGNCPAAQSCTTNARPVVQLATFDQAAHLKTLYNSSPIGLCFLDKEMRYVSINRELAQMNEISVDDHIGKTPKELMPNFFPKWEPHIRTALAGTPSSSRGFTRLTRDGQEVTVQENYAPVVDEGGEVIGVSVSVVDVTAQVRAQETLNSRMQQYRKFLSRGPSSPWLADESLNMLEMSSTMMRVTGMTKEECNGKGWLKALHPDDERLNMQLVATAVEKRRPYEATYRLRTKTGEWRWVCSVGSPMFAENGDLIGWCGYTTDLAEEKIKSERRMAELGDPASATRSGELTVH